MHTPGTFHTSNSSSRSSYLDDFERGTTRLRLHARELEHLEGQGKKFVARASTVGPLVTGWEFWEWIELILDTVDVGWSPSTLLICFLMRKIRSYKN